MFEIREITKKTEYNPLSIDKNAPFTQAWFYGEWQKMMGREVRRFEIKKDSEIIGFFQAIKYSLPLSRNLLYIPHAPVLSNPPTGGEGGRHSISDFLKAFREKLIEISKQENAIFARFDPYFHNFNNESKENLNKYFKKVPAYAYHSFYFQPKFEWVLDLSKTEEELLKAMHPKTRYNIGLAERKGIRTEIAGVNFSEYFGDFHKLMEETAKRDNFNLHPEIYYQNIFRTLSPDNAFLAVARHSGKNLAVNLILLFGETAYFLFGGSSDEYKNLMAPHLAHWQGIVEAKNRGYKFYNFGGMDLEGWKGISRFKKGFGGRLLEYSDSYDLASKQFWYYLYNLRKWALSLKSKK